jgi:hypothetical protein
MSNKVQDSYFAHIDHKGERADKFDKPELHKGAYEFIAPDEYTK